MAGLDELSAILFKGTNENSVAATAGAPQTTIVYGVALANSANGEVRIQLDGAIYAADDLEDEEYEFVSLTDSDDDVNAIEEDEELEDPEDESETVYWSLDDDDAVGSDDEQKGGL